MATRIKPDIRWEIDWSGDGRFRHPSSDVTEFVQQAVVDMGMHLSPASDYPTTDSSHGFLVLDNIDRRFSLDNDNFISLTDKTKLRSINRWEAGILAWTGKCRIDHQSLAFDSTVARMVLQGRSFPYSTTDWSPNLLSVPRLEPGVQPPVQFNAPSRRFEAGGAWEWIQEVVENDASENVFRDSDPGFKLLDRRRWDAGTGPVGTLFGPFFYRGTLFEFLDRCAYHMGGWFIENQQGTQTFVKLDDALTAHGSAFVKIDPSLYEQAENRTGGPLMNTLANTADIGFASTVVGPPQVIERFNVNFVAGTPVTITARNPRNARTRAVLWADNPIEIDVAVAAQAEITTVLGGTLGDDLVVVITPTVTGTYEVRIWGRRVDYVEVPPVLDRALDSQDWRISVRDFGEDTLGIPDLAPWQALPGTEFYGTDTVNGVKVTPEESLVTLRKFLRQHYRPLYLVSAEWSPNQAFELSVETLVRHVVPTSLIEVGTDRILVMNVRLEDRPDGTTRRSMRGIRLYGIDAQGRPVPPPGIPGSPTDPFPGAPEDDPDEYVPPAPYVPRIDPILPPPGENDTGITEINVIMGEPPGLDACDVTDDILTICWPPPTPPTPPEAPCSGDAEKMVGAWTVTTSAAYFDPVGTSYGRVLFQTNPASNQINLYAARGTLPTDGSWWPAGLKMTVVARGFSDPAVIVVPPFSDTVPFGGGTSVSDRLFPYPEGFPDSHSTWTSVTASCPASDGLRSQRSPGSDALKGLGGCG